MDKAVILTVDDTESALFLLGLQLREWGYKVISASNAREALALLKETPVDLVISDQVMPGMDGIDLLRIIKETKADLPFIMLTAHGSISKAVTSIRKGADDYLEKPYAADDLKTTIERSLSYSRLKREHRELTEYLSSLHGFSAIVTRSPLLEAVLDMARKVAQTPNTTVAISGESGTGKEILARAIHTASGKIESRFIAVNCAAIPASLLESELFGHVKGAFTGADRDREGMFDLAREGTILLDEIGDMPLELQAKLLRVLEERCYMRVGSATPIKCDFRVITTTNRNLADMVSAGTFRPDLYHRISSFPLTIPPLRERPEDIPLLADHFLKGLRRELGKPLPGLSAQAMTALSAYSWPGNVRELKNCLERAAILTDSELITPDQLTIARPQPSPPRIVNNHCVDLAFSIPSGEFSLDTAVGRILEIVLDQCRG
ncbi:MAG TPA: sigma-54 dependent transcriptional regulator, partial [Geobacteraceae bacterium]